MRVLGRVTWRWSFGLGRAGSLRGRALEGAGSLWRTAVCDVGQARSTGAV